MAFKMFYLSLWMLFILFTVVKGSCLEYGHSCWGAHGKRSGNNRVYPTDIQTPIEVDFQDLTGLKEKDNYDSNEEQRNSFSSAHDMINDNDKLIENPDKNSFKLKKFLYKKLNRNNEKQGNLELPKNQVIQTNSWLRNSERWRRLPLYNLRNVQISRTDNPDNEWFKQLEQEQQLNENDYI